MHQSDWYYAKNGERVGPISLAEMRRLLADGTLTADDLVWNATLHNWVAAAKAKGLLQSKSAGPRAQEPRRVEQRFDVPAKLEPADDHIQSAKPPVAHFLDHLVAGAQPAFPGRDLADLNSILVEIGRYGCYAAMPIALGTSSIEASKAGGPVLPIVSGLAFVVILLTLQYSAVKMCRAIWDLIQATPMRMRSPAFFESFAVVSLGAAMVGLAGGILMAVELRTPMMILPGAAIFAVGVLVAVIAISPKSMNVEFAADTTTGEDAIAMVAFFLRLPARFAPAVFALGSVAGGLALGGAGILMLKENESYLPSQAAIIAAYVVLASAAFPLVMYVYFVFCSLFIDLARATLALPAKIDKLSDAGKK